MRQVLILGGQRDPTQFGPEYGLCGLASPEVQVGAGVGGGVVKVAAGSFLHGPTSHTTHEQQLHVHKPG